MLTKEEFIEELIVKIKIAVKGKATVDRYNMKKMNNITLDGIVIRKSAVSIAPIIYVEEYYEDYLRGSTIEEAVHKVLTTCKKELSCKAVEIINQFDTFDIIKEYIVCKLINHEMNKELLEETPHIHYLDLAIIFQVAIKSSDIDDTHFGYIRIDNQYVSMWGINTETLFNVAKVNMIRCKPLIQPLEDVIMNLIPSCTMDIEIELNNLSIDICKPRMWIMTNKENMNGANTLLSEEVLKNFAEERGRDLIILPSSIHEVILLEYGRHLELEKLKEMVREINMTQVPREEILSYNIYLFKRDTNEVCIWE